MENIEMQNENKLLFETEDVQDNEELIAVEESNVPESRCITFLSALHKVVLALIIISLVLIIGFTFFTGIIGPAVFKMKIAWDLVAVMCSLTIYFLASSILSRRVPSLLHIIFTGVVIYGLWTYKGHIFNQKKIFKGLSARYQ